MATNYYYKFRKDEVDPSKDIPVAIDELLLPKLDISSGASVPKDKESGYFDVKRDLSNTFELYGSRNIRAGHLSGEKTNIYFGPGADQALPQEYYVVGTRAQGTRIWDHTTGGGYNKITVTLDGNKYPSNKAWYLAAMWDSIHSGHGGGPRIIDAVCAARFVLPGDSNRSITFDWDYRPRRHSVRYYVKVFEAKPYGHQLAKGDLSSMFAAKDSGIPWWWHALKCPHTGFRRSVNGSSGVSFPFEDVYTCSYGWYNVQKNNDTYYKMTSARTKAFKAYTFTGNGGARSAGTINFGVMG